MGISMAPGPFNYNRFELAEKKADKDYDGDGKVESGKAEYFGSKDKAIKKAMGKKVNEGKIEYPKGPFAKFTKDKKDSKVAAGRKAAKDMGLKMNEGKGEMPDFIKDKMKGKNDDDADKGDKDSKDSKDSKKESKKSKCECKEDVTVEMLMDYLMAEGYVDNEVSAEVVMNHGSDKFIDHCLEEIVGG